MKKKYIKVTVDVTFEAGDGNMFDSASNAESAIGNYLHDWLSDNVEVATLDTDAESYEE